VDLKIAAISLAIISAIAAAISYFSGLGYWLVFAIVAGAVLFNGFVATVEDDLPGGFNNPDGTDTPRYIGVVTWAARGIVLLSVGLTVFVLVLWGLG